MSELEEFSDFNNASALIWHEPDIYLDWKESNNREHTLSFDTPQILLNNGTIYAHVFFTKVGFPLDPRSDKYDPEAIIYGKRALNKYAVKKPEKVKKNLISGELTAPPAEIDQPTVHQVLSYWKPNLTLHLVDDFTVYPRGGIPPQIQEFMVIDPKGRYYPVIFFDEFWLMKENLIEINSTVTSLNLTLSYSPISLLRWQMMMQMEQSFKMQQTMGTSVESESDEFKRMLVETNPYLLGITMVVTLLHTVFDFLAFKNDITFWKNRKSMEGTSVRTLFLNFICQVIIFLYLVDNDTSWMILISCGIGLLVEIWKIRKAVIIKIDRTKWIPISFEDRESYASKTREYDIQAMRYLSWALYPLVVGYAIYSLTYETHKSWYSWILASLTGCVYTFGFIMMCPQLFINYKLKSVAHLPFRAFMYKALNTIIDDLFAFIIKMPTLHRLSCFRDDIIFLIFLYQRWVYRVDYSRVNEFGQGGDDDEAETDTPTTVPPTAAATTPTPITGPENTVTAEEQQNKEDQKKGEEAPKKKSAKAKKRD